jgi:hypothetical protein
MYGFSVRITRRSSDTLRDAGEGGLLVTDDPDLMTSADGGTAGTSCWKYFDNLPQLPDTERILARMCDMRIPLIFDMADCEVIAQIIADFAAKVLPGEHQ